MISNEITASFFRSCFLFHPSTVGLGDHTLHVEIAFGEQPRGLLRLQSLGQMLLDHADGEYFLVPVFFDLVEGDEARFLLADGCNKTLDLTTGAVTNETTYGEQAGYPYV